MSTSKIVTICAFIALVTLALVLLWFHGNRVGGGSVRRVVPPTDPSENDDKRLLRKKPTIWDIEMGVSSASIEECQPISATLTYHPEAPTGRPSPPTSSPPSSLVTFSVLILPPSPPPTARELAARHAKWIASSDSGNDDDDDDFLGEEVPEVEIGVATSLVSGEQSLP